MLLEYSTIGKIGYDSMSSVIKWEWGEIGIKNKINILEYKKRKECGLECRKILGSRGEGRDYGDYERVFDIYEEAIENVLDKKVEIEGYSNEDIWEIEDGNIVRREGFILEGEDKIYINMNEGGLVKEGGLIMNILGHELGHIWGIEGEEGAKKVGEYLEGTSKYYDSIFNVVSFNWLRGRGEEVGVERVSEFELRSEGSSLWDNNSIAYGYSIGETDNAVSLIFREVNINFPSFMDERYHGAVKVHNEDRSHMEGVVDVYNIRRGERRELSYDNIMEVRRESGDNYNAIIVGAYNTGWLGGFGLLDRLEMRINDKSDTEPNRKGESIEFLLESNNGKNELENDVNTLLVVLGYKSNLPYVNGIINIFGKGINSNSFVRSGCEYGGWSNCGDANELGIKIPGYGILIPKYKIKEGINPQLETVIKVD